MKGKPNIPPRSRSNFAAPDPGEIAIEVLNHLISAPDRLSRFLALTGLDPATIRAAARDPGFLAAVLDHVASDERLLLEIANETQIAPDIIAAAQSALSPSSDFEG